MLGDMIELALTKAGITKERVERWLGHPCNCKARQDKLNALSYWARRVLTRTKDKAAEYLEDIIGPFQDK